MLTACHRGEVYSEYRQFPVEGWHKDSVCIFTFDIESVTETYDVVAYVRHDDRYRNQNIWLFTSLLHDSLCLHTDTLNFYLANKRGEWLGSGIGTHREMPCLLHQRLRFPAVGTYSVEIRQGMREDVLGGINDVGLSIELSE